LIPETAVIGMVLHKLLLAFYEEVFGHSKYPDAYLLVTKKLSALWEFQNEALMSLAINFDCSL
jgi:hypothetical protein